MLDNRIITSVFTLVDVNGRFLLQHRTDDAPRAPGYWSFFGGRIERGEKPELALLREAREELGIKLRNYHFFNKYETDGRDSQDHEKFVFVAPLTYSPEYLIKNQKEGQGLGFFYINDAKRLKIKEGDIMVLEDIRKSRIIKKLYFDFIYSSTD